MTSKKQVLLTIIIIFAIIFPLSSCSSAPKSNLDPKNPVTVSLWHYYVGENKQALEAAVDQFNQSLGIEKGVIISAVAMGSISELEAAITESAAGTINAQPMPQIFSSYPDKALEIDALDMIVDLNEYFTESEKNLFVSDFLGDGIFENSRFLLVPIVKSTELLYVNATAWQEFADANGYDSSTLATWESLYEAARAYYTWSDGKSLMGVDSLANFIIIGCKQLGVNVINAEEGSQGVAVLDNAALRKVFDLYYQGSCLGYFDAIGKFRSDDIKSGDLISYVGSSSSAAYFPTWIEKDSTRSDIDFLPLSYPIFTNGEAYAIQQGAGMCVAKSTPAQQEGAVLFLKWFTDPAQNINFAMTTGYLPVQQNAYDSEIFQEVLGDLNTGSRDQQNVAGVYNIALQQITKSNTYAARPFLGSYSVRTILQSSLTDIIEEDKATYKTKRQQGMSEEELLAAMDLDARFNDWLQIIRDRLDQAEVAYRD